MPEYPTQTDGLDLTPTDDGFIIYDPGADRVHYLNHTAALVLLLCDGHIAAWEIPGLVQKQFNLDEPPEREVDDILSRFIDEGLVTEAPDPRRSRADKSPC